MNKLRLIFLLGLSALSALGQNAIQRNGLTTNQALATNMFVFTNSMPWVRVFPDGTAYCQTGQINTAGTKTAGLNEAIHALYQTNGTGLIVGGGKVILAPGIYDCTTNITIPNQFNFELSMEGAGKANTLLVNSSINTNFITVENVSSNPSITNGGTRPFTFAFRNMGFSQRYDTNRVALVFFGGKVNQGVFDNCAFSSLQCLQFTATNSGNPPGQGGGLLFIPGTPTNAVGTVGIWINGGADNKYLINKCDFYGLAGGILTGADHNTIVDCMFAVCGRWYTAGGTTPHDATAWPVVNVANTDSMGISNMLSHGFGILGNNNVYELNIIDDYFFESGVGIINYDTIGFGPKMKVINPEFESTGRQLVAALNKDDEAPANTSILNLGTTSIGTAYIRTTNAAVFTGNPSQETFFNVYNFNQFGISVVDQRGRTLFNVDADISVAAPASGNVSILGTNYGHGGGLTNIPPGGIQFSAASLLGRSSAGVGQQITVGSGLSLSGTTLTASAGAGAISNSASQLTDSNVKVATLANNDVLTYISADGRWTNKPSAAGNGPWSVSPSTGSQQAAGFNLDQVGNLVVTNQLSMPVAAGAVISMGSATANAFGGSIGIFGKNSRQGTLYGNTRDTNDTGLTVNGTNSASANVAVEVATFGGKGTRFSTVPVLITNTVNTATNLLELRTSNGGSLIVSNDASITATGPLTITGSGGPGLVQLLEGTAPGTPAANNGVIYADSTTHQISAKDNNSATVSVMVTPDTGSANNFLTAISSGGVISKAQPTIGNITAFTSSALAGQITDETGSGVAVFGTSPTFTTQITTPQTQYTTNSGSSVAPDFNLGYMLLSTNAAFTFLAPVNVDSGKTLVQTCVYFVTNTTAAAVLVTAPANCHASGTMYVTNLTCFSFSQYGNKFTNVVALPLY